jgi:hypothetical protein
MKISRHQHTDRRGDGLNQPAKGNNQQRKAYFRGVNVCLRPGFGCHTSEVLQSASRDGIWLDFELLSHLIHTPQKDIHQPDPPKGIRNTVLVRHGVDSGQRPRRTEASPSNADTRERHDQLRDAVFAGCEATKA